MNTCFYVAREINNQILWSISLSDFFSWGVSKKCYGYYKEMPTLMLHVNGMLHKGWVYISLNEGRDVYEVRLLNRKKEVVRLLDEVFCDNLGLVLDSLIEKPTMMSDEEYQKRVSEIYSCY